MNPNTAFELKIETTAERELIAQRIESIGWDDAHAEQVVQTASELVQAVRETQSPSWMQAMLSEYQLSNPEGLALMSLAEAVLRVPDAATRMALVEDKVLDRDWGAHQSQSDSPWVNTATRGLMLLEQVMDEQRSGSIMGVVKNLIKRMGEPVIDLILGQILKQLGGQFVLGQTITEALDEAQVLQAQAYTYSYDMLGEGAKTDADAQRYWQSYHDAIEHIGARCAHKEIEDNPGISIKLSALHPRYEVAQQATVIDELTPKVIALCQLAAQHNMGLNIDAEEAERLNLSLKVVERIMQEDNLQAWRGLGVVVQAYNPSAAQVIDALDTMAQQHDRRIMVRLVKGAYWDAEIKRAQVLGLARFPVHTRKAYTDVAYIANARRLLEKNQRIYAQFATHNAHTVTAVLSLVAQANAQSAQPVRFEFQRLHGMGEALHDVAKRQHGYRCRIYAPVGQHHDLLSYLVRRLLENGANGSFVHQIADVHLSARQVAQDPIALARICLTQDSQHEGSGEFGAIQSAEQLYSQRRNSQGWDLSDSETLEQLQQAREDFWNEHPEYGQRAEPVNENTQDEQLISRNPARKDEVVGRCRITPVHEVDALMAQAQSAQPSWAALGTEARAALLERIAQLYETQHSALMALLTREAGKSWSDAAAELREAVDFCHYYAQQARALSAQSEYQARGVVVCISPWNFPLAIFTGQVVANLVVGNAVLAKPAELSPLIAEYAVSLMHQAGVPKDVLQLVQGAGSEVGQALVALPEVAGVCFTGSMPTARRIQRTLANHADADARLIAETGGLNAMIVDSTALPEQAVRDIIASGFQSAGQRCSALRMLYVQADIYDKLLQMLKGAMNALVIGDPADIATDVSPVIDDVAQDKLQGYIDANSALGKVLHQIDVPNRHKTLGYFVAPTLIEVRGIDELGEEQFGPIVHIAKFEAHQLNEVLEHINASGYGLTLGVHTRIERRAQEICARARVGNVYVNRNQIGAVVGVQPFGGCGLSGTGPKAGGPMYLRALINASTDVTRDAGQMPWQATELEGPTGERNQYRVQGRGTVLCLGPSAEDVRVQLRSARATRNHAWVLESLWEHTTNTALEGNVQDELDAPEVFDVSKLPNEQLKHSLLNAKIDAVAYFTDQPRDERAVSLRRILTNRAGAIIPLMSTAHTLHDWVHEFHVCTDSTAAGGNAELLANSF